MKNKNIEILDLISFFEQLAFPERFTYIEDPAFDNIDVFYKSTYRLGYNILDDLNFRCVQSFDFWNLSCKMFIAFDQNQLSNNTDGQFWLAKGRSCRECRRINWTVSEKESSILIASYQYGLCLVHLYVYNMKFGSSYNLHFKHWSEPRGLLMWNTPEMSTLSGWIEVIFNLYTNRHWINDYSFQNTDNISTAAIVIYQKYFYITSRAQCLDLCCCFNDHYFRCNVISNEKS